MLCPIHPILEDGGRADFVLLLPNLPQVLFHIIGQGQGLVEFQRGGQPFGFLAAGVEVFRVFEEQPAGALQDLLVPDFGSLAVELTSQVSEAVIIEFDEMKVVKDMDRVRQVSQHGTDIGRRQIGGHGLDAHLLPPKAGPERLQGLGPFAVAHKDYGPALEVQDDGQIAVPLAEGDLIDGDLLEFAQLGAGKAPAQAPFLDVFDDVPAHLQMAGHILDGHVPAQLQGIAFEGPGITPPPEGKRNLDLAHHLAQKTENPRDRQLDPDRF